MSHRSRTIHESAPPTGSQAGEPLARRLTTAIVVCAAMFVALVPISTAGAADATEPAAAGAAWLGRQLDANIPLELFGSSDWGVTIEAASALAAVDVDDARIDKVWSAVVENREVIVAKDGADIPGALAKVILLAHSTGEDPRAVGSGPGADLVERLAATLQPSGLFGTQFPGYDGVYRQGLAIAALASAGVDIPSPALDWLANQQCTNAGFEGAFMSYRADTSIPCADNPAEFSGADSNATALAVTALAFGSGSDARSESVSTAAIAWLGTHQGAEGAWGANSWSDGDPNSTAVVIQALIAAGGLDKPELKDRIVRAQAALVGFQLGADADEEDRGGLSFPGAGPGPNLLATVQAVPALASKPLVFVGDKKDQPTEPETTTTTTVPSSVPATTVPTDGPAVPGASVLGGGQGAAPERAIRFTG